MKQADIFISHTSEERELALAIKELVVAAFGDLVAVYVSSDGRSVRAGDQWLNVLADTLKRSTLHFVLCSEVSVKRPWVNFEAGAAWVTGTPTVPICHSGTHPDDLPLPLNTFQGVALGSNDALILILNRVGEIVGRASANVGVDAWSLRLREIERRIRAAMATHRIVSRPRVLCATIADNASAFGVDVEVLESTFDGVVTKVDLDAPSFVSLLSTESFDIVHLFLPVDPDNGSILFGYGGESQDTLSAAAFRDLVKGTGASLVVLATCKAVLLAVQVAPICNMIACDISITDKQLERWMRLFYPMLKTGRPLSSVFKLATDSSGLPMYLLRGEEVAYRST